MKYLFLGFLILISSCSTHVVQDPTPVSIRGTDIYHVTSISTIRGMGVRIDPVSVLTSAHVVPDDRLSYHVDDVLYRVVARDMSRDLALLMVSDSISSESDDIERLRYIIRDLDASRRSITRGSYAEIRVIQSGSWMVYTGSVTEPHASIGAYDSRGGSMTLSGILLTDISLESGESGAPIYDQDGDLIDLVHVR